jgi:cell division septation protein DedD
MPITELEQSADSLRCVDAQGCWERAKATGLYPADEIEMAQAEHAARQGAIPTKDTTPQPSAPWPPPPSGQQHTDPPAEPSPHREPQPADATTTSTERHPDDSEPDPLPRRSTPRSRAGGKRRAVA